MGYLTQGVPSVAATRREAAGARSLPLGAGNPEAGMAGRPPPPGEGPAPRVVPSWSYFMTPCEQVPGGVHLRRRCVDGKCPSQPIPEGCVETGEVVLDRAGAPLPETTDYCCPRPATRTDITPQERWASFVSAMPGHLQPTTGLPVGTILLGVSAAAVLGYLIYRRVR